MKLAAVDAFIWECTIQCTWDIPQDEANVILEDGFADRFCSEHGLEVFSSHYVKRDEKGLLELKEGRETVCREWPKGVVVVRDIEKVFGVVPMYRHSTGVVEAPNVIVCVDDETNSALPVPEGYSRLTVAVVHTLCDGNGYFQLVRRLRQSARREEVTEKVHISRDWLYEAAKGWPTRTEPPKDGVITVGKESLGKRVANSVVRYVATEWYAPFAMSLLKLVPQMDMVEVTLGRLERVREAAPEGVRLLANDVATALVWRAITAARSVPASSESTCFFAYDGRQTLADILPPSYIGNMTTPGCMREKVVDFMSESLVETAARVRRAVSETRDRASRELLEYYASDPNVHDTTAMSNMPIGTSNLVVTNWARMRPHAVANNFKHALPPGLGFPEGVCVITEDPSDEKGLRIYIGVFKSQVEAFMTYMNEALSKPL